MHCKFKDWGIVRENRHRLLNPGEPARLNRQNILADGNRTKNELAVIIRHNGKNQLRGARLEGHLSTLYCLLLRITHQTTHVAEYSGIQV